MDTLIIYLRMVFLFSFPELFAILSFLFAVWRFEVPRQTMRIMLVSLLVSLTADIDLSFVPGEVHALIYFLIMASMLYAAFRSLGARRLLLLLVSVYVLGIITEIFGSYAAEVLYNIAHTDTLVEDHFYSILSILLPVYMLLWIASYPMSRRKLPVLGDLAHLLIELGHSPMKRILILAFFQAMGLALIFIVWNKRPHPNSALIANTLLILVLLLAFATFFYTLRLLARTRDDAVRDTQDLYVEEINKMFVSIRGQRHDFLNHVQVIHTMLQMNKYEALRAYVAEFVKEAQVTWEVAQHDSPALIAFVQAKTAVALSRNIAFNCDLPPALNIDSSVKTVDLVKMLGNLVDNAFDAVEALPPDQRYVSLEIRSGEDGLTLRVRNRGRVLDRAEMDKILTPGYTTKQNGHSGLGLAIVLERVEHYRGKLAFTSDAEDGTVFRIHLPHDGKGAG